jgi:ectoine hydroxylase-related dioxygenase (phytanoyl-CoA dioxygenase family)
MGNLTDAVVFFNRDKNRLVWRGAGAGSFKFGSNDGVHRLKVRVPMREGSFLIWDQRVAHGSAPNASDRPRMAQFVKGFMRRGAGAARLARRAARIRVELARAGTSGEVSALGWRVFGLDAVGTAE